MGARNGSTFGPLRSELDGSIAAGSAEFDVVGVEEAYVRVISVEESEPTERGFGLRDVVGERSGEKPQPAPLRDVFERERGVADMETLLAAAQSKTKAHVTHRVARKSDGTYRPVSEEIERFAVARHGGRVESLDPRSKGAIVVRHVAVSSGPSRCEVGREIPFGARHVKGRASQRLHSSGMIDVEVGREDVFDVSRPKPDLFDPRDDRPVAAEFEAESLEQTGSEPPEVGRAFVAEGGVDQHRPVACVFREHTHEGHPDEPEIGTRLESRPRDTHVAAMKQPDVFDHGGQRRATRSPSSFMASGA